MALGTLCKMVDQDVVVKRLLPLYDIFVQDDTWHIRRACCTILASFIGSLPLDMKASKVEEIYDIFSVDVSRSVRNSVMEVLGEVIAGFEKEKVPDSLLSYFLDMGQQPMNDHERAVMCAFSFPAVVLTAGRSKWELMKPVYIKLAGSFRAPIRRSLACSLHEIAKILGPELADRDLAPAFADCLMALEDEVKEGVLGHIVDFISCLSPSCRSDVLHDLLRAWTEQLERSSNWRLRDTLTGQIAALCEIADGTDLLQVLLPLAVKACTDSVSTIRESGVLAFPALWEASGRVGPIPVTKKKDIKREFSWSSSNLVFPPLHVGADEDEDDEDEDEDDDDEENEDEEDENENEKKPLFVSQSPDHDMEDVEMEDMTGDSTDSPKDSETEAEAEGTDDSEDLDDREGDKYSVSLKAKASEQQKQRQQQQQKRAQMQQKQQRQQQEMTTIKEQIIAQTKDFAIHGGFRSRVVAVQIIQSLLDYGVSIPEFEDYFLPILADRLADDSVANIRIWVARVVTWIVDSGYYGDAPISPSLRELHLKLQEDPDRDVRIYSGGPLILPEKKKPQKPKKAKRKAKNKNGDNEDNGKNKLSTATDLDTRGSRAVKTSASTLTVFHQNPKSGELMAIEDRDEAEIQLLFQNELNNEDAAELNDSDEEVEDSDDGDDDGDDDDNDNDEDEDDNDNDGDEKGGKEEEKASQGSINGPEASFRSSDDREVHIPSDLNSDDKCTVRPSDPAREEEKEERPVPVELRVEAKHTEQTGYAKPSTNSLDIVEQAAVAQDGNDSEDEKDEEEDEDADEDETTVVHSVVPYSTSSANGVSPLDVEMEEDLLEKEEPRDTDSGPSSSETEESSELESSQEPSIESCATVTIVDTTSCSNNSTTTTTTATAAIIATFLGLDEPTVATAFPPLSSSSKSYPIQWRSPPPALSYAALLKGTININNTKSDSNSNSNQQKSKGRTSSDITTLTSFRQANLSEPLHHTATATSASIAMTATTATTTTAPMTTTIVNTTPTTTTGDKKLNSLKKDNILIEASLSLSASRLSPSSSLSSSSSTSPSPSSSKPISSSPVTFPLRFSYAAVAARTFSPPPLTPVIGGTSTAMTF
ncbi:hypothetical protein BX616_002221 [Lobosporangium transversale]|nr:hypothetical protein BX616_002221 [Lobosporangium transversale]